MTGTAIGISVDGTPTGGANPWIDSLVWGNAWANDPEAGSTSGPVRISYFAYAGTDPAESFFGTSLSWTSTDRAAIDRALATWEAVANIDFVLAADAGSADVWLWKLTNDQAGDGVLGWSEIPGTEGTVEPLYLAVNGQDGSWTSTGLGAGGYGFVTLVHEIGHLLGLAHPHDGGAAQDATNFPGVVNPGDLGQYDLNQGIFTTMSYNDGWTSRFPAHDSYRYGWQATPMALDIAAVQSVYGANMSYRTGADVYELPSRNAAGTSWSCIWDAGGTDRITNAGSDLACVIDLRAAPLTGPNAGGHVSQARSVIGGFTIANGVVIENATGGTAADRITGNGADNRLAGGRGDDTLSGGGGDDILLGGAGRDRLTGGAGDDVFVFEHAPTAVNRETITDFTARDDTIRLEGNDFSGLRSGALSGSAFVRNASGNAADRSDRIIYETDTGKLWFDRDGTGSAAKVHFATLDSRISLTEADFFVF